MKIHRDIHEAPVHADVYVQGIAGAGCDFVAFKYGESDDETTVYLWPAQVAELAVKFTEAVAAFQANGSLPGESAEAA